MTNGGIGVAFFAPFDPGRDDLPWRPIVVSPLGIRRVLSAWGLAVVASELAWVAAGGALRRRRLAPHPPAGERVGGLRPTAEFRCG